MATDSSKVTIYRFDPSDGNGPHYQTYSVPPEGWHGRKVIDTIRYIYEHYDQGLSFREPCRQQLCGACTVRVNDKPVLACSAFSEKELRIEPLPRYQVLKDLIVDRSDRIEKK